MSTAIALRPCYFGNEDYAPVSESSRAIKNRWQEERNYLRSSATDWLPTIEGTLNSIRDECRDADWDSEGAFPVKERTIDLAAKIAVALFESLPTGIPAPDVIPEADGEICITWTVDPGRMFSLSVGEHGNMNYAGQFGRKGGVHAWQPIEAANSSVLEESVVDIVRYIQRLYKLPSGRSAAR